MPTLPTPREDQRLLQAREIIADDALITMLAEERDYARGIARLSPRSADHCMQLSAALHVVGIDVTVAQAHAVLVELTR